MATSSKTTTKEDDDMARSKTAKGVGEFDFTLTKKKELPARRGGSTRQKYDWSVFPPPTAGGDYTSAVIEGAHYKTIHNSIKKYRQRLVDAGTAETDLPAVSIFRQKDDKGEHTGVEVFRTK